MDDDLSFVDLIEDTPTSSPVFLTKRQRIGSNLSSRRNILRQASSSSIEMSLPSSEASTSSKGSFSSNSLDSISTQTLSSANSQPKQYVDRLPLPSESNFAEERAKAIHKKKQKDKTSPFKLPNHARSDFVKSSTLLASPSYQAPKTHSTQTSNQNYPRQSCSTVTQSHKRKSDDLSVAKSSGKPSGKSSGKSPVKLGINRNRVIGWPSSSDSSSDDDLQNSCMIFKTKRVKHRHGSDTGQLPCSSNATYSLSNCNHVTHSVTNQHGHVTKESNGDETVCKHGKTTVASNNCGKSKNDMHKSFEKKMKKKININNSNTSLAMNRDNFGKTSTSRKYSPSSGNITGSAKHSPECKVKSKVSSKINKFSLDRNTSSSTITSKSSTYNISESPSIVSSSSVQSPHKSPSLDIHPQPCASNTSPTINRNLHVSRNLSPTFDQRNLLLNHASPPKINCYSPPSPIFSPPSILGYNPSEYNQNQLKTPERVRPAMSRFHPYNSWNHSPIRPSNRTVAGSSSSRSPEAEMLDISPARADVMSGRGRNSGSRLPGSSADSPIMVDLTTPETSKAVKQIRQIEKDEEMARKLQEELDKEFALTLAQQQEGNPHQPSREPSDDPYFNLPEGVTGLSTPPRSTVRQPRSGVRGIDASHPVGQSLSSFVSHRSGDRRVYRNRRPRGTADGFDENQMDQLMDEFHAEVGDLVRLLVMNRSPPRARRGRHRGHYHVTPDRSGNDYDELLRLGEMIGDATNKGLSQTDINRLPTLTYKQSENPNQEAECNICMCNYEDGDTQKILPCFHTYHSTCIDKWIAKNASCPVCRVEIKL